MCKRVGGGNGWSIRSGNSLLPRVGRLIREANRQALKTASNDALRSPMPSDKCGGKPAHCTAERCCPTGVPHYRRDEFSFGVTANALQQRTGEISFIAKDALNGCARQPLLERASKALAGADAIISAAVEQSSINRHGMLSELLTACASDRILFVDCETLGFGSMPIFLIGALEWLRGLHKLVLHQWLAHDYSEEPLIIEAFLSIVNGCALISFNGKAFDVPMLRSRCMRYKLAWVEPVAHIDLIHISRKLWGEQLGDCRLSTLCVAMRHPVSAPPSSLLPELYCQFVENPTEALRESLLLHNAVDVCALPVLLYAALRSITP